MTRRALPVLALGLSLVAAPLTAAVAAGPAAAPAGAGAAAAQGHPSAPPEIVALRDVDPTIVHEIRYATNHNFVGERIDDYRAPLCLLTRPAAEALSRAQTALRPKGLTLKVYDCYRPQGAVDHFVRWAEDLGDEQMKSEFYPRVEKSRLFEDGYIAAKSGHSRASTVDLTIQPIGARPGPTPHSPHPAGSCFGPVADRAPDASLDMGTAFDCFDVLSHTANPAITGAARANRDLLVGVLGAEGFTNLPEEWWHFTHKPELFPTTFFTFPVSRASLAKR
ncbi:M15 family metallopeptidase [Knoellia locipacati]|uniref:D-alanyl-D-alanine dipeptidase n=1 Tax=Knoellia locipacati TaxID=882824 RepID=A0A512T0I5_9MICO|nr:M15 family metallopeptidase [Knoellia locipacati]GEQ13701.1 D-alanyl-D-alanine dipeptidase [Knoellia locipacati]